MRPFNHRRRTRSAALAGVWIFLLGVHSSSLPAQKASRPTPEKAVKQSKKAADLLDLIMAKPAQGIPKPLLTKAVAVAIFTDVKKFGFLIEGASIGHGVVSRRLASGKWSAPSFSFLRGVSIGPQLNASSFSVVMLFMNDQAAEWLLDKKSVVFDRAKAPVAGPVGEIRTDQKEVVPVADVFSYIYDDGHLQTMDLKNMLKNFGITHDNKLNKATYGITAAELLADLDGSKSINATAEVSILSETLARYFAQQ